MNYIYVGQLQGCGIYCSAGIIGFNVDFFGFAVAFCDVVEVSVVDCIRN